MQDPLRWSRWSLKAGAEGSKWMVASPNAAAAERTAASAARVLRVFRAVIIP